MVWVNTYRYIRYNIPYGGYKISGLNRENGSEGLEPYFETKSTIINLTGNYRRCLRAIEQSETGKISCG